MVMWVPRFLLLCLVASAAAAAAGNLDMAAPGLPNASEEDLVKRLKIFIYPLPRKYNEDFLSKDSRCLNHMFASEIHIHEFLLSSAVRTFDPEEANWFYTPVYTSCELLPNGYVLIDKMPRIMRSVIQYISTKWPYWNRTEGADHFFTVPHDYGACFHYQEWNAIDRGILPLLQRATLLQTFGAKNHTCFKEGTITIPPYAPPHTMQAHLIPARTPRSIFAYFRGLFFEGKEKTGELYSRGVRASIWENFKANPIFDISKEHSITYYEDMQRAIFCLCPLGWAKWCGARLVQSVIFSCIPVVISNEIVMPFADTIPWEHIAVFVKEEDVPRLDTILTSIPVEDILNKQRLLTDNSTKRALLFPEPSQPGDAFHQILSRLARRLPHGSDTFLKPGERVLNWTAGQVSDFYPW